MATLARLFDFTPSTPIVSADVDAEFNQLVNILNGGTSSKNAIIKYSDAATPPLQLDQIGAGRIQDWLQTGVVKASVTNAGSFSTSQQFISTLATGTKPIDVTSTTLCTNLNADLLDGIQGANFMRLDVGTGQIMIGNIQISHASDPAIVLEDTDAPRSVALQVASHVFRIFDLTGGTIPFTIDMTTDVATFLQIPVGPASNPTTANQLSRKQYVDDQIATAVLLTGNQTVAGIKTFSSIPVLPASNPTGANEAARKQYVDDAVAGVDFSGIPRIIVADSTANGMTGVTETDLTSFTIPAGTLPANNDYIKFRLGGTITVGNASTWTVRVKLNGTTVLTGIFLSASLSWDIDVVVIRTSDTTCKVIATAGNLTETSTGVAVNSLSGSGNIFKATGQTNGTTGGVTQHWLGGEKYVS